MTASFHPPGSPGVRPITRADLPALMAVIASSDLFPADMLGGMTAGFLRSEGDDQWLTLDEGEPVALACFAPERMAAGTWNLLLIAVHADRQGRGHGTLLIEHVEQILAARGERLLIVETSGLPGFEATRRFYERRGYVREATIRDFYADGEDKVVFWKRLLNP